MTEELNTDGVSKDDGSVGCGGVLRDINGVWICGFSKFLSSCGAYIAEF
ncbi:hypothetical protein L195_g026694 [Trifolium pratense]|uniref:Uncharacterized protein n=1 Tax=Trifolium pratense TaxID=57577 RepID=A0A2K3NK06_TRIPR|nr:hypothetical protein L195_g026694 [Trifolium pratense]